MALRRRVMTSVTFGGIGPRFIGGLFENGTRFVWHRLLHAVFVWLKSLAQDDEVLESALITAVQAGIVAVQRANSGRATRRARAPAVRPLSSPGGGGSNSVIEDAAEGRLGTAGLSILLPGYIVGDVVGRWRRSPFDATEARCEWRITLVGSPKLDGSGGRPVIAPQNPRRSLKSRISVSATSCRRSKRRHDGVRDQHCDGDAFGGLQNLETHHITVAIVV